MHLFKTELMVLNQDKILISFLVKCVLNGTFEMKQLKILVKRLLSDVSRLGNLHKEMLGWNYFKVKLRENYLRYFKNVYVILIFEKKNGNGWGH